MRHRVLENLNSTHVAISQILCMWILSFHTCENSLIFPKQLVPNASTTIHQNSSKTSKGQSNITNAVKAVYPIHDKGTQV